VHSPLGSQSHFSRHDESGVALGQADVDALGAALAVQRIDEEPEVRRLEAALGGHVGVLGGVDEVLLRRLGGPARVRLAGRERLDRGGQGGLWLGRATMALSGRR